MDETPQGKQRGIGPQISGERVIMKLTDEIMAERRLERLNHLMFFMQSPKVPVNAQRHLALGATHSLLRGFFENSYYRTAWFCVRKAFRNSWMTFTIAVRCWYYEKVLRLTEEQIEERF